MGTTLRILDDDDDSDAEDRVVADVGDVVDV